MIRLTIIFLFISNFLFAYKIKRTSFPVSEIVETKALTYNYIDSMDAMGRLVLQKEFAQNGVMIAEQRYNYFDSTKIADEIRIEFTYEKDVVLVGTQAYMQYYFYNTKNILEKIATVKTESTDSIFKYYDTKCQLLNQRLNYTFDDKGRILSSVPKAKNRAKLITKYFYKGEVLLSIKEFEGKKQTAITEFTYDKAGNILKEVYTNTKNKVPEKTTTTYVYKNGLLTKEVYETPLEPASITYYEYE